MCSHRVPSHIITANITIDDVLELKTNQKPWQTAEVHRLLNAQNAAFRAGNEIGLTARANLSHSIREAKNQYSRRIAHCFSDT